MNKQMAVNSTIKVMRLFESKLKLHGVEFELPEKDRRILEEQIAHIIYNEFLGNAPRHAVQYQARMIHSGQVSEWMNVDEEAYKALSIRVGWEVRALAPM